MLYLTYALAEKRIRTIFLDFANLRNTKYTISANDQLRNKGFEPSPEWNGS